MSVKPLHIPQLDGLRALAVLFVLLVHTNFFLFNTGWIGVPIFFVLSGFLITSILLRNKGERNYFSAFYGRRALRIFPVYYLVLLICLGWGLAIKTSISQFPFYFFYLQSYLIAHDVPPAFCNGIMGHTWSLSVEELFYLAWPIVLYLLRKQILLPLCGCLSLLSLAYKLLQVHGGTEQTALLSGLGNLDCLMAGAILSLYFNEGEKAFNRWHRAGLWLTLIITLTLIVLQYLPLNPESLFLSKVFLSVSTTWLSVSVIFFFVSTRSSPSFINKLFSARILLYIGKISYGVYLYHTLVYRFTDAFMYHYSISWDPGFTTLLKIACTFVVASLSWHLIEKPLLRLKDRINYKTTGSGIATYEHDNKQVNK